MEWHGARALPCGDDFGGVLRAEDARVFVGAEIERGEFRPGDVPEIERRADHAALHKFVGHGVAEAFDVEHLARCEVPELRRRARRAREVIAAPRHKALPLLHRPAARRTFPSDVRHEVERHRIRRPPRQHHFHHRGNDLAGFFDDDGIAHADVLALDFLLIVQRGARHGAAGKKDRLQLRHRCQDARAPHLHSDRMELRLRALGFVLISHRPARRLRGTAHRLLRRHARHLHHRAVRFVRQRAAHGVQFADGGEDSLQVIRAPEAIRFAQTHAIKQRVELRDRLQRHALRRAEAVEDNVQRPPRRDARVELLERPGGGIARIRKARLPRGRALFIHRAKGRRRHEDLAAHLQQPRRTRRQRQREPANGARIRRDVIARRPVAARGRVLQRAVFITHGNRHAVHLRLDDGRDPLLAREPHHALIKLRHFPLRVSVVQTHHPHRVRDLGEALDGRAAHALRRGIRRGQRRPLRFEVRQFAMPRIVLAVRNHRRRVLIIETVVVFQFSGERGQARLCFVSGHARHAIARRGGSRLKMTAVGKANGPRIAPRAVLENKPGNQARRRRASRPRPARPAMSALEGSGRT